MTLKNSTNAQNHIENLLTLLRIPTIGTLPEHKEDMLQAAFFLEEQLKQACFTTVARKRAKKCEDMPPIVYAERIDNPENPTILVYNHYDVQPVDPLNEWNKPPFVPVIENGNIYGRGTTDDKGQLMTHLAALSELSQEWGETWPINFKIVYEGQEESGGANIKAWLEEKETQELLKADIAIISDTGFASQDVPSLIYGLRGIAYFQLDVKLANNDLHSGSFGGGVLNPANALTYILSKLFDVMQSHIIIPEFYKDVNPIIPNEEKALLAKVPFDKEQFLKDAGNAVGVWGEDNFTLKERISVRPSFDINGIWGGFSGNGAKTIIPSEAHAKFSFRLLPEQNPAMIAQQVEKYIMEIAPSGVKTTLTCIHTGEGALISINSPWMQAAKEALKETFHFEPVFTREGGSIPIVADFKKYLGIDTILMGYSLPDDNHHAPNEKFSLKQFQLGIECNKQFYKKCAKISPKHTYEKT